MSKLPVNPWIEMWTAPRQTMRALADMNPKYGFIILSGLYGLPVALQIAQNLSLAATQPLWAIAIEALMVCVFLGGIGISIAAGLLYWTGKWIKGVGSYLQLRSAVAWSNVTNMVNVFLWVVLIASFKEQIFLDTFGEAPFTKAETAVVFIVFLAQFIMSIWSFVLLVQCVREVQGFPLWKALVNILISFGIVIAGIWFLGMALGN